MNNEIKPLCLNSKGGRNGVDGLQPSLNDRVYDSKGIATACTTSPFFMPYYTEEPYYMNEPFIVASRGRKAVGEEHYTQNLEPNIEGTTNTLTNTLKDNYVAEPTKLRIRKLTPKECWRLMGFTDNDFAKAEAVNSNTQLYKQAGNSIVVPVLEGILGNLHTCGAI